MPVATLDDGAAVMSVLRKDFVAEKSGSAPQFDLTLAGSTLCRYVCPNRDLAPLLFELLAQ